VYLVPEKGLPEISSTEIREALKKHRKNNIRALNFLNDNLKPEVFSYIIKNSLYL
jgi:nicotinic acid mononucleotide adenylyltransferase